MVTSIAGDVRKVQVIDGCLSASEARSLSASLQLENPQLSWAATTIQASARRRLARVQCAKELGVEVSALPGAKSLRRMAQMSQEDSDDY